MDYLETYSKLFSQKYNEYGGSPVSGKYSIDFIKKNNIKSIIDISTGTGTFLKLLSSEVSDIEITCTDLNKFNNLDYEFISLDLSNDKDFEKIKKNGYELLTCLDVLEHLDKSFIENVLNNFAQISKNVILTIANHHDIQNGVELHTIIEDMNYWEPIISKYFYVVHQETHEFRQVNNNINYLYVLTLDSKIIE